MSIAPLPKVLISHFTLFLFLGVIIWAINVFGQTRFYGNDFFPFFIRSLVLAGLLVLSYGLNGRFIKKNKLNTDLLKFRSGSVKPCFMGSVMGFLLIAIMWGILYLIYPFEIKPNPYSKIVPVIDLVSYSLGNTLEELLFRGFWLLASVRLFGKAGAVLLVSFLFGLFHLQGLGLTKEGLSMVMTTFTMSLLFIAVIDDTGSIWPSVALHITVNLLLHTLGFDGAGNGILRIEFAVSELNGLYFTLIYELVVMAFAAVLFIKGRNKTATAGNHRIGNGAA